MIAEGRGPLVVLLPSSSRDSEDFDDVAAGIAAAGFRVLRPQPRGMGNSVGSLEKLTLHDLAGDIARVIAHEQSGPAVIVGHAFGQWVARMAAVDHPALVRGVVLAAAAAKQVPQTLRDALATAADAARPEAERLAALRLAFFAPGNDPSSWLTGWHKGGRRRPARCLGRDAARGMVVGRHGAAPRSPGRGRSLAAAGDGERAMYRARP